MRTNKMIIRKETYYICEFCNKRFSDKEECKIHEQICYKNPNYKQPIYRHKADPMKPRPTVEWKNPKQYDEVEK